MVSCPRGQDKPVGGGGTFYPGVNCPWGQDTTWDNILEGQDKPVHRGKVTTTQSDVPAVTE